MDQPKITDFIFVITFPDRFAIMAKTKDGKPHEVTSVGKEEKDAKETADRKCLMAQQSAMSYGRACADFVVSSE